MTQLASLLTEGTVLLGVAAQDKWELLDRLLETLVKAGKLAAGSVKPVRQALVARENIASTGLEHGVAIPHATVDAVDQPLAVLATSPGVPFQSSDGQPARVIILIVIPRRTQRDYIRTLAGVARLLNYEEMRDALTSATSPAEVLRILREEESKETGK